MTTFVETANKAGAGGIVVGTLCQIDASASEAAQGAGPANNHAGMRTAEAISFKDEVMFNSSVIDPSYLNGGIKQITTP